MQTLRTSLDLIILDMERKNKEIDELNVEIELTLQSVRSQIRKMQHATIKYMSMKQEHTLHMQHHQPEEHLKMMAEDLFSANEDYRRTYRVQKPCMVDA